MSIAEMLRKEGLEEGLEKGREEAARRGPASRRTPTC